MKSNVISLSDWKHRKNRKLTLTQRLEVIRNSTERIAELKEELKNGKE